ncbi:unnamed protein product [Leptosia nina]|uniref:TOG domain-containing protein n=1 Tax=Leptosia nina TaxID=320188 RepID=A0AAV1J5U0_9NEOP
MEEEIEDIVGEVNYTDSQKSVTTSNVYSLDFTDSGSDRNHSSSKETYVIDYDDSDESDKTFQTSRAEETVNLKDNAGTCIKVKRDIHVDYNIKTSSSPQRCSISQEIYTQTSKTIIELAQNERSTSKIECLNSLETQTSFLSITENKTVEYHIQVVGDKTLFKPHKHLTNALVYHASIPNQMLTTNLEDKSSIHQESENEVEINKHSLTGDSDERIIKFIDEESQDSVSDEQNMTQCENTSEFETSKYDSDIEEDSLENENQDDHLQDKSEGSEIPKSIDNDIEDLYNKLSSCEDAVFTSENNVEHEVPVAGLLTPLTEESNIKKSSITDLTPSVETITNASCMKDHTNNQVVKSKSTLNGIKCKEDQNTFRLPPINSNFSCPNSPLNFMLSNATNKLTKTNTLPLVSEDHRDQVFNRWGVDKNGSGENALINIRDDTSKSRSETIQLPPIHHGEGGCNRYELRASKAKSSVNQANQAPICIKGQIKELKMTNKRTRPNVLTKVDARTSQSDVTGLEHFKFHLLHPTLDCLYSLSTGIISVIIRLSRSPSPTSTCSPDGSKLSDAAERGCEALCCELLRRLRLNSWCQTLQTLEELPKALDNFWSIISENRIADLIRQVTIHADSPRTQVARTACQILAEILKNTNYTKKPDFFEAVAILLIKTGSYCRPVRKAANVALDTVVCSVDVTQSVTAICIYGTRYMRDDTPIKRGPAKPNCCATAPRPPRAPAAFAKHFGGSSAVAAQARDRRSCITTSAIGLLDHKSALVRCASARLLVVCAAFAEGGRMLLRGRPPSVATARRHVLRSLSELLYDKNSDTRKYAERLYAMLRPLNHFEAYYLTDVDIEVAARQMKKYDRVLSIAKER